MTSPLDGGPLTPEHLERLERCWVDHGLRFLLDALEPGLTDDEMDALAEPHGLVVPPELRLWWGWRNGAGRYAWHYWEIGSLQASLDDAAANREVAQMMLDEVQANESPLEGLWQPAWLPFWLVSDGGSLFVDTSTLPESGIGPVCSWHTIMGAEPNVLPSIGVLVDYTVALVESGYVSMDATGWEPHESKRPDWVIDDV